MSNSVLFTDNVVFESIEHLNMFSNVEVKLPDNIPYDCNLVCYTVVEGEVNYFALHKETDEGLFSLFKGGWEYSSESLQAEIDFDKSLSNKYIYVQINRKPKDKEVDLFTPDRFELVQENTTTIQATAKRKDDDLFTPDCLVGVETNYGYITNVLSVSFGSTEHFNPSLYVYTTESLSKEDLIDVHTLKYYISDESDETVSFTEYVNMFYDGWYNENEIKS